MSKGLVAHYTFDRDATNSIGNGHNAAARRAKAVAEGKLGGAFAFNGTSNHKVVPPKATAGLTCFTVAMWFETTQAAGSPRSRFESNPTLFGVATGGWGSSDVGLMLESGNLAHLHGLQAEGTDTTWWSPQAVANGKWRHVALVCEGPRMRLCLDGRLARGEAIRHTAGGRSRSVSRRRRRQAQRWAPRGSTSARATEGEPTTASEGR